MQSCGNVSRHASTNRSCVPLATRPEDHNEVLKRQLARLPYKAWCPACVKGKDAHFTDDQQQVSREYPTISFDLFYIGKRVRGEAWTEVASGTKEKVICLAVVDSFEGQCKPFLFTTRLMLD